MFGDYTFYVEQGGRLTKDEYDRVVRTAYAEILSQTNGAALTAPPSMGEAIKLCECALVDTLAGYRRTAEILPKGVSSVSNDGYAVSIGDKGTHVMESRECRAVCLRYLQGPVNLMCRWV